MKSLVTSPVCTVSYAEANALTVTLDTVGNT
jgi:hypothetical protein